MFAFKDGVRLEVFEFGLLDLDPSTWCHVIKRVLHHRPGILNK
jgi:hypothetical protein